MSETAFIAEHPSTRAVIDRVREAEYRIPAPHRTAGAVDSRLICMSPRDPIEGFGE